MIVKSDLSMGTAAMHGPGRPPPGEPPVADVVVSLLIDSIWASL
jgi:hypothetical protein